MNQLFSCKICDHKVAQNARLCPNCGIKEPAPAIDTWEKIIAAFVFVGFIIVFPNQREWFGGETAPALWQWMFYISWKLSLVVTFFNIFKKHI